MTMKMQINGKGKMHDVATIADASNLLISEQSRIEYRGPGDQTVWPRDAVIYHDGVKVARVSQNGRVWGLNGDLIWQPGDTFLGGKVA